MTPPKNTIKQYEVAIIISDPESSEVVQRTFLVDSRVLSDAAFDSPYMSSQEENYQRRAATNALIALRQMHDAVKKGKAPVGAQPEGRLRSFCKEHPMSTSRLVRNGLDPEGNQKYRKVCCVCEANRQKAWRERHSQQDKAS